MIEEKNHHIEETKKIIELLDRGQSFLILGPTGSGKTYLLENVVIKFLDEKSDKFFGDSRRLYVRLSFNNIGREELEIFYNSFFPLFGFEVENFKNYSIDDIVEKICWGFRQLTDIYRTTFYIVVDDFEFFTDSDINKLMQFKRASVRLVLATNERRYPHKYSEWFDDFERVVVLPITEERQKKYFFDSLVKGRIKFTERAYKMVYSRLKLMYFYPGAVKRAIERLVTMCGDRVITTDDVREHLRLHRWGLKYRDLTIGLFCFVFVLFFMRFLFLRGPESYRYAIYAGLSVMGVWFYRLFARRLMRSEEDEFVALPEYAPKWYNKYASLMSALLHIGGFFLSLFCALIVFDKKFETNMLIGLPFVFLMDIDISHSYIARLLKSLGRQIYYKIEWWIDDIDLYFAHRGVVHSLLFVVVVSLLFLPVIFVSFWSWMAIVLALLSHLMVDALSPMGVPLFYPALHRWVTPFSFSKQIPVGSLREGSTAITMMIICLILLPVVLITPSGLYELITKDPFTAIKKITAREEYLQYAFVEGFNVYLSRYVREKMKVIRSTGEKLYLEGADGFVYKSGDDINIYKVVRETTSQKIKYVSDKIKVVDMIALKDLLDQVGEGYFVGELHMYSPLGVIDIKTPSTIEIKQRRNVLFGVDGVKVAFDYASRKMVEELLMFYPIVVEGKVEIYRIVEVS